MADHGDFLQMAREMIAEDGRSVTFFKLSDIIADPLKPGEGAGVPTEGTGVVAYAVFLPHAGERELGRLVNDTNLFKESEQIMLIAPPQGVVNLEDYHLVLDGGERWRIEIMRTLKPGPLPVLHVAGVRR